MPNCIDVTPAWHCSLFTTAGKWKGLCLCPPPLKPPPVCGNIDEADKSECSSVLLDYRLELQRHIIKKCSALTYTTVIPVYSFIVTVSSCSNIARMSKFQVQPTACSVFCYNMVIHMYMLVQKMQTTEYSAVRPLEKVQ